MASFDTLAYSRLWRDRAGRLSAVSQGARQVLAAQVEKLAKLAMTQLIYSKPEDVSATGRKLWTRTGRLIGAEKAAVSGNNEIVLSNGVDYAEPRHEAGKPGRRPINPARFAPWREAIRETIRQEQLGITRAMLQEVFTEAAHASEESAEGGAVGVSSAENVARSGGSIGVGSGAAGRLAGLLGGGLRVNAAQGGGAGKGGAIPVHPQAALRRRRAFRARRPGGMRR